MKTIVDGDEVDWKDGGSMVAAASAETFLQTLHRRHPHHHLRRTMRQSSFEVDPTPADVVVAPIVVVDAVAAHAAGMPMQPLLYQTHTATASVHPPLLPFDDDRMDENDVGEHANGSDASGMDREKNDEDVGDGDGA